MVARRQLQTGPAHDESRPRLLIYSSRGTHLHVSKARKVFAATPKYEQITQKLNTHKAEVLYGRITPSGGALASGPAQQGSLAQGAQWDNPPLDTMLGYYPASPRLHTY